MHWIIIVVVILLLYYWYDYYKSEKKECIIYIENYNNDKIIFLSKNELENILISDIDNFYDKFKKIDYKVRKINNISEYSSNIKNSVSDFTENEKKKIVEIVKNIERKFTNINLPWLNGQKFNNIPWKIGLVKGYEYENGLPHTRNEYIIINRDHLGRHSFFNTMIHEKVHVYQKMFPEDVNIFLNTHNFKKIRKVNENDMIRVNMDIDDWIYSDENGNEYKAVFNKNPVDIQDVRFTPCNSQLCEHPFEKMAIEISNM